MKNCKMAFTIGLVFAVMMLVAACTDSNKSDNHIFDHESLDVDEYVYPSDFDLGDDLKGTNSESDAGFEELSGIPGTLGGAVRMNAGAHGKEMKDIITEITAIDYNGQLHTFTNEQAEFTYRNSIFSSGKYIILQAKMMLEKGNTKDIKAKMDEYAQYRKDKQPIEYPSAGSTFKRGDNFITAKLIDEAGLKGYSIGGAKISEKHAGFIINTGSATAQNVLDLAKYVTDKVYEKFGKKIEFEIKVLGL